MKLVLSSTFTITLVSFSMSLSAIGPITNQTECVKISSETVQSAYHSNTVAEPCSSIISLTAEPTQGESNTLGNTSEYSQHLPDKMQAPSDVLDANVYYDLRAGVERHFDSTSGFELTWFNKDHDYYSGIERVLGVVEIDGIQWSEVEWIFFHSRFDASYNLSEPSNPKQLFTTVTNKINYLRMDGPLLIRRTDTGEQIIFDFDIALGDNITDYMADYVDLSESLTNVSPDGIHDGTIVMARSIEFPDQITRLVKWGDAGASLMPSEEVFLDKILYARDSWLTPSFRSEIYDAKLPYMQVEGFGVLFSPYTHRGLYLKGITSELLDRGWTSGSAGQPVSNFASTPVSQAWQCGDEIRDTEGNRYRTVAIEDICWMADNMATATYNNGTAIPELREYEPWTVPANGNWAHYENDISFNETFGKLYNGYAVTSGNGLCPADWRVPTAQDWDDLRNQFGESNDRGVALMTGNTFHWVDPGMGRFDEFNQSGFNATAAGVRSGQDGVFRNLKFNTSWWSSTSTGEWTNQSFSLDYQGRTSLPSTSKAWGFSVRCVFEQGYEVSIDEPSDSPALYELNQNYPNPFNPTTSISYSLPEATTIKVEVHNVSGQIVAVLESGLKSAGRHNIQFDASGLSSGVYFYRIQSGFGILTQKMLLIK